jgi:uncharacterized DUF497 family protein
MPRVDPRLGLGKSLAAPGLGKNVRGVIVVVFATLGKEAVSVTSMRPASKYERKLYAKY